MLSPQVFSIFQLVPSTRLIYICLIIFTFMFELIRAAWLWKFNQSWLYDPIIKYKLVNTLLGSPNVRTIASSLLTVVCYVITISIGYIRWRFNTILGYRAICLFLWKIFPMSVTRSKRFVFLTDWCGISSRVYASEMFFPLYRVPESVHLNLSNTSYKKYNLQNPYFRVPTYMNLPARFVIPPHCSVPFPFPPIL